MEKRGEPSDLNGPLLELHIDARILGRLLSAKGADAPPGSDLQICCTLRAASLHSALKLLGQALQNSKQSLTSAQLDGLGKFHEMTYKLPELKNPAQVDEVCHAASVALFSAAGPAAGEVKDIPMMRPRPEDDASQHRAVTPPALTELVRRAQTLTVSTPLRRQLLALAGAAADPHPADAGPLMIDTLSRAIELADGIQHNTALDPADRPALETQVADGLALFTDVRTRNAGRGRLESLGRYHATLVRIRRLSLSPELRDRLGPAFVWIQRNPDKGAKLFDVVEEYLQLCGRFDGRGVTSLPAGQKKNVDDLARQFTAHRASVLDDASQLAGPAANPDPLAGHVAAMRQTLGRIESIERLPRALQVLAGFKPRPAGGLERRAWTAVSALGSSPSSALRDDAASVIADIGRLAVLAGEAVPSAGQVPVATARIWAGGKLEGFDARRAALISELASEGAAAKPMDPAKFEQLQTASALAGALRDAAMTDAVLRRGDVLARWADWQIDAEQLRNLIVPYREATAAAFEGFAHGDFFAATQWPAVRRRYLPITTFVNGVAVYVSPCEQFPEGLAAELAKLATPLDAQPFAVQRRASVGLLLRARALQLNDTRITAALTESLSAGLRRDLKLGE